MRPEEVEKILNKPVDPKVLMTSGVSVDRRLDHLTMSLIHAWQASGPPLLRLGRVPKPVQVGLP